MTGVDNAAKLEFMRSLGADEVVDRSQGFTDLAACEHVLDLVAHRPVFAYRRALVRGGRYHCVGGSVLTLLRVATIGALIGWLTDRRLGLLAVKQDPAHFEPLAERCVAGDVQTHIDRTFRLDDAPQALAYVGEGALLARSSSKPPETRTRPAFERTKTDPTGDNGGGLNMPRSRPSSQPSA